MRLRSPFALLLAFLRARSQIIPVRCFTCGKVVGDKWGQYLAMMLANKTEGEALDELGLRRYCCRRMILTHVDLIEKLLQYNSEYFFLLPLHVQPMQREMMAHSSPYLLFTSFPSAAHAHSPRQIRLSLASASSCLPLRLSPFHYYPLTCISEDELPSPPHLYL